ncbi:MAG TPA: vWA domain-containing protein [Tepidisphaeraceae bacterium]|jgi:hypothetical protein|nr:vWA domain-containing protein [Tepidisphaeraceae bacterium]
MTFEPLIPTSLWLALAVAGALLIGWYALRRPQVMTRVRWGGVVGLMAVAVALALLILLNPIRVRMIPPPAGRPLLTVLVDASASMGTPDAGSGSTRYASAAALSTDLNSRLGDQFEVRVRSFSGLKAIADSGDLSSARPDGQTTDIGAAIADNLGQERPQGQAVVVLSDGIQNIGDGPAAVLDAVRRARSMDVPVFTRTFGGGANTIDLAVQLRSAQDLAFVGQRVPVNVRVTQTGAKGIHANVSLLAAGKEIGRQEVTIAGDAADVRFWATQEKVGVYPYEARVEPVPGEATEANNSATYLLRVIDQPIRVLALEGKPYWDSKFLVRTLASVPAVELDSVVRISEGRFMQRAVTHRHGPATRPADAAPTPTPAPAAPADDEKWQIVASAADILNDPAKLRGYQIIVLGRDSETFLGDDVLTNLQNWISHDGGSLVCYRGSPVAQVNQKLARLLPVKWTASHEARFSMKLTDQGRNLHWFGGSSNEEDSALLGLPTLASAALVDRSKPLAVVLATSVSSGGADAPAVVYQPYGTGRAVVIEGAGMWRWAFLPPQFQQREEVYSELWHSLLRWLTSGASLLPGQKMTLRADKVSFATIEPATATLLVREEATKTTAPTVELLGAAGEKPKSFVAVPLGDEPGVFRVTFGILPQGRYTARVAGGLEADVATQTFFDVRAVSQEQLDLQVRPDLMARIAADSGGTVLGASPAEELAAKFREHMQQSRPPRYERTTAWDRPWALLAVFAIWCLSWFARRSGGLV